MWQAEKFGIIKHDSRIDFPDTTKEDSEGANESKRKPYCMGTSQRNLY